MEKLFNYCDEEDTEVLVAPYYIVWYIDDEGRRHIATVTNESYLHYLEDRFIVESCKKVEKEDTIAS